MKTPTLQTLMDTCHDRFWAHSRSERTVISNSKQIMAFFGETTGIQQITTQAIDQFIKSLEQSGDSDATTNRKLSMLSTLLTLN
ncbi:MAG: site-specific integrase [Cyanobacteria bacterium P01_H01_bin.74]